MISSCAKDNEICLVNSQFFSAQYGNLMSVWFSGKSRYMYDDGFKIFFLNIF